MNEVLFNVVGSTYVPTELAGSPWHPAMLHGGAPAGLLAHCLELEAAESGLHPARLSIDLLRPVPKAPLQVNIRPLRQGKRILLLEASLLAGDNLVALATALFVKPMPVQLPEYAPRADATLPPVDGLADISFSEILFANSEKLPPGLHTTVRLRPISRLQEQGSGQAWIELPVSVIEGRENTPFMLAALVADFSNGVGQLSLGKNTGTINADILLQLSRLPQGNWIGLDCTTLMAESGIGQVVATLYDSAGRIGQVNQTVMPMGDFSS